MEENKEQNMQSQNVNPSNTINYNNYSANAGTKTKKKGHGILIAVIIIIAIIGLLGIAVIGGLVYYFGFYTRADQVYSRIINSSIDSYTKSLDVQQYKTSKGSLELSANIDSNKIDKDILNIINKMEIKLNTQIDNENKKIIFDIDSNYDAKDLLDIQMYANAKEEKTYMYLKNLLDKYVEIDLEDEMYDALNKLFENQNEISNKKDSLKKKIEIIKGEINKAIKQEYCTSVDEEIEVNGKKINTSKYTMKLTEKQLYDELANILKNLKNNESFLKTFDDQDKTKETIEKAITEIEKNTTTNDKNNIEMSMYTTGLFKNDVVRILVEVNNKNNEKISMVITKLDDKTFEMIASENDKDLVKIKIYIEEENKNQANMKLELEAEELGKATIKMKYTQKFDEKIDEINVQNAIKSDNLTQEDQRTLMKNLQDSELYKLIEKFSGTQLPGMSSGNNVIGDTTIDTDINTDIGNTDDDNNVTTTGEAGQIISYDSRTKIDFKVPSEYKLDYISKNYATLKKSDVDVVVKTTRNTKDKYYASLKEYKEKYYSDASRYKDVTLSDMGSMVVNGVTFYVATFSYTSVSGSYSYDYSTKYVWTEISDTYILDVQIKKSENMTEQELNDILTINVSKNQ